MNHEERAREICSPEYFGGVRANDAQHVADVAEALRTVELEAYERAAKVADAEASRYPDYDRFSHQAAALNSATQIAQAIRALGKESGS